MCMCVEIPGPGAHKIVDLNIYKTRPPKYSMTANHPPPGDHSLKPGPGSHYPEKVLHYSQLLTVRLKPNTHGRLWQGKVVTASSTTGFNFQLILWRLGRSTGELMMLHKTVCWSSACGVEYFGSTFQSAALHAWSVSVSSLPCQCISTDGYWRGALFELLRQLHQQLRLGGWLDALGRSLWIYSMGRKGKLQFSTQLRHILADSQYVILLEIYNKAIIKYPTLHQTCHCTTNVRKLLNQWNPSHHFVARYWNLTNILNIPAGVTISISFSAQTAPALNWSCCSLIRPTHSPRDTTIMLAAACVCITTF